ncbi:MBL fold metallo-hydrolase [Roseixanthobacter liquoris]|uniref:MBL fold metallo-hydrolase n=1 Tax=Roseixanthobacter liquoris TaxID=3119921 RepID=UPI0037288E19
MAEATADFVKVRMYRGILGDCFLLTTCIGGETKYALIDCGVLQNVSAGDELVGKVSPQVLAKVGAARLKAVQAGPDLIKRIVADILETTGEHIDLLILTHEHFDHLCGFYYAKKTFQDKDVIIDRLWMAWTEDPADPQAQRLRKRLDTGRTAVAEALAVAPQLAAAGGQRLAIAEDLAAFMGLAPEEPAHPGRTKKAAGAATDRARSNSTRGMIQQMQLKVGAASTSYLAPGQVLAGDEGVGLRTYVLGPPRDEVMLQKDAPSARSAKEVYLTQSDDAVALASAVAASERRLASGSAVDGEAADQPFARPHRWGDVGTPGKDDPRADLVTLYRDQDQAYRRIDHAWVGAAEALALKMDSDTNNTSLALAMELPDGQVLLFPGDAQVGNWLSWRQQDYPKPARPGESVVTIDDLLRRVVFYKVGHHGSRNATLVPLGLRKMVGGRLTAAIPVVEAVAAVQNAGKTTPGAGWDMPFPLLHADLVERTEGRIVQGDGDPAAEAKAFVDNPTHPTRPVRVEHQSPDGGLWVELTFPVLGARASKS